MMRGLALFLIAAVWLGLSPATADERAHGPAEVVVNEIFSSTQTAGGQPIVLPRDNPQVIVSEYIIAPGATLPVHKHPFARYALVLEGELRVTLADSEQAFDYTAGDFIVEVIDAWHYGANIGDAPVRLIVIDQVEEGRAPTVLQDAR